MKLKLESLKINKHHILVGSILFVTLLTLLWATKNMGLKTSTSTLKVLTIALPESTDPLKYDAFVHHLIFRSVYSSLITEYSNKGLIGDLAVSWRASNNFKDWEFTIDPNRRFSNGDLITAEIVLRSFKRVALIQKQFSSELALFRDLFEIENLNNLNSNIRGFELQNNKIVFHFKSPQEELLRQISFGTYGIVHPNDYDSVTGEWKNPHKIIASGFYRLESMSDGETILSLKEDIKSETGSLFGKIIFLHKSPNDLSDVDLIYGSSESQLVDDRFYFSSPINSTIRYVVCGNWEDPNSPFNQIEIRKILRSKFYDFLNSKGLKVVRSFFPLAISGIKEFSVEEPMAPIGNMLKGRKIYFLKVNTPKKSQSNLANYSYVEGFNDFVQSLSQNYDVTLNTDENPILEKKKKFYTYDLSMNFTGILIDSPRFDIQFMFLSSEGIHLPDSDGSIYKEVRSEKFDLQKVNSLLWDQAIVWPVNHLALGLWVRKDSNLNLEGLNLALPPVDFRFVNKK